MIVAEAIRFFTASMGAGWRDTTVDCTVTSFTDNNTLSPACRAAFHSHGYGTKAPIPEFTTTNNDRHSAALARKSAEVEIRRRLRVGRVATVEEALNLVVRERLQLTLQGAARCVERLAQDFLEEVRVHTKRVVCGDLSTEAVVPPEGFPRMMLPKWLQTLAGLGRSFACKMQI